MMRNRKRIVIVIGVIAALVAIRAALPHFVTRYANKELNSMADYGGSIADVDMSLYRGAYRINGLKIFKLSGNQEIPFIDIPTIDLSVEWKALFKGGIVGEAVLHQPVVNFINKQQAGENVNWLEKVEELFPIRINRFEVLNGTVTYYDLATQPKVDLRLEQLNLVATNFANVENPERAEERAQEEIEDRVQAVDRTKTEDQTKTKEQEAALPAAVRVTAVSIGGGRLDMDMRLNPLKQVPDLDMNLRFENVNMPALNDFFRAYAKVDVEQGTFSVYSEMTVRNGVLQGYVKPVAENVEIVDAEDDDQNPISLIWQAIVGFVIEVFKNKPEDQLATQVPLSGDLNNVETSVWVAIWNIFSNGFEQAFSKSTNNSLEFGDPPATAEDASNSPN